MAHRKKKAGVLILMAALCMLLWGCGGNGGSVENVEGGKSAVENAGENGGSGGNAESLTPSHTLEELREEAEGFSSQTYPNMDFSGAEIVVPKGDEIEELIFPADADIGESEENYEKIKGNFYENICMLTGKDKVDEECVYYNVPGDEEPIHVKDITDEDRKRSNELALGEDGVLNEGEEKHKHGFGLSYCDEEHSMTVYGSSFMTEIAGSRVAGYSDKKGSWLGYRPPEGSVEKAFDIPEDSIEGISYPVDGKELSLKDAVAYVEKNMPDYHYVRSPFLEYRVFHVDVVRMEKDGYYYRMRLKAIYREIPFSYEEYAHGIPPVDGHDAGYENYSSSHQAVVMSEDSIDYLWSSAYSFEEKKEGDVYDRFISIGDAADILSGIISDSANLKCARIEFLYRTEFYKDELGGLKEAKCHPVYQFKFTNTGLPEYPVLFFNVDALTGMVEGSQKLGL